MDGALTLHVQILHASPGRIRLRVQPEDLAGPALRQAQKALATVPGVHAVQTNPLVRSVLLTYDDRAVGFEDLLSAVMAAGVIVVPNQESTDQLPSIQPLDQTITTFFRNADARVREGTSGFVDLRTLLPAGLAALAFRELLAGRLVAAPWYVLLWYSFDSFLKLRRSETSPHQVSG